MKVKELIEQLNDLSDERKELNVFIWIDGYRYFATDIDNNLDDCVDINADQYP